jgi:AmiR/NasT family two-component response regulator
MTPGTHLRGLRALMLHPRDADGESLIRMLHRFGCQTDWLWPPPAELPLQLDLVIYLVDQQMRAPFHWLASHPAVATIAIVADGSGHVLRMLTDCMPQAVLCKPVDPIMLLTNLILARNNFRYERRLLSKIAKLEETLRSIRKVERAKAILMQKRHIEEPEAYEFLRRQAMRKRVPIGVIATAVIDADEVLTADEI